MTENEINITDMIKALQCVASQDADGDCYCDHFNAHLTCEQFGDNARLDEKHMSCGGVLKDTQSCPYSQKTYGVCYEDGELWWLKDVVSILTEIQQYRAIGTVEELIKTQIREKVLNVELESYKEIGTIEEFKTLKEKSVAKKPTPIEYEKYMGVIKNAKFLRGAYWCPNCNHTVRSGVYCDDCGQKLDWQ